jgi:hypothetical protein
VEKGCCELKITKKILVLVLAFAMILSMTACSKKPIDYKKFKDVMEDKFDFEVEKGATSDEIDKSYYASDEDGDFTVSYTLYEDPDDAEDEFDEYIDDVEEWIDDDEIDGKKPKVTGSGDYQKAVVKGDHDDFGDMYVVLIRSEGMLLMVGTNSKKDKDIQQVDKIVKGLGY